MEANVTNGENGNRILASLPPAAMQALQREMKTRTLEQGHVLFEPGAPLDTVYFPHTGMISLLVLTREGGAIETGTVGKEGAVGLHGILGERLSFTRATTQLAGKFSTIPSSRLARLMTEAPDLRMVIQKYTEVLWAETQQTTACNAAHDAAARLARWLLQSADRTGNDNVALTQDYIAQMLGVRRTTVTLLAQALQNEGVIAYSRGQIKILDRAALEARSCECYRVMKRDRLMPAIGITF